LAKKDKSSTPQDTMRDSMEQAIGPTPTKTLSVTDGSDIGITGIRPATFGISSRLAFKVGLITASVTGGLVYLLTKTSYLDILFEHATALQMMYAAAVLITLITSIATFFIGRGVAARIGRIAECWNAHRRVITRFGLS
jgi:hypothetical protein